MSTSTTSAVYYYDPNDNLWQMVHVLYFTLLCRLPPMVSNTVYLGLLVHLILREPSFWFLASSALDRLNVYVSGTTVKQLRLELTAKTGILHQVPRIQKNKLRQALAIEVQALRAEVTTKDEQIRILQAEVQRLMVAATRRPSTVDNKRPESLHKPSPHSLELDPLVLNLRRSNGILRRKNNALIRLESEWKRKYDDLMAEYDSLVAEYDDLRAEQDAEANENGTLAARVNTLGAEKQTWVVEKKLLIEKLRAMSSMKDTMARNEAFKKYLQTVKQNADDPWVKNTMLRLSYNSVLAQNHSMKASLDHMEAELNSRPPLPTAIAARFSSTTGPYTVSTEGTLTPTTGHSRACTVRVAPS